MNNLKFIFKFLFQYLQFLFKSISIILIFIPKLLKKIIYEINKGLRFSISFKITAVYTFIFSISLLLLSIGLIIGFRCFLLNEVQSELTRYNTVTINYAKLDENLQNFNISVFSNIENVTLSIFDKNGNLINSTQKNKTTISFHKDSSNNPVFDDVDYEFVTSKLDHNNKTLFFQFSKKLDKENEYWGIFTLIILFLNVFSLIITLGVGSKASKKMLLPIKDMTKTTKAISI